MSVFGKVARGLAAGLGNYLTYQGKQQMDMAELERRDELLARREMARANVAAQAAAAKEEREARRGAIGQAAFMADNAQNWDAVFGELGKNDPEAAKLVGQFTPQLRASLLARAGLSKDEIARVTPEVMAVTEGGTVMSKPTPRLVLRDEGAGSQTATATATPTPEARDPRSELEAEAQAAIARGADPAKVYARLAERLGGAGSGQRTFP